MLKSISMENYKCFKDKTDIEIAPLTVLCGANSSGKSSILKSLLMLKQSYENESTSHTMLFSGDYVDNGSFDDVVYHKDKSDIKKDSVFTISTKYLIRDTSDDNGKNRVKRQDIMSFKELKRVFEQTQGIKNVKTFVLKTDIEVERPKAGANTFDFFIESNIIKKYNVTILLLDKVNKIIDDCERYIKITKIIGSEKDRDQWEIRFIGIPPCQADDKETVGVCTCYVSGLQIKNLYIDNLKKGIFKRLPNILSIFKIAAFQTDGCKFIAPLREQPMRRYNINGDVQSVGIAGEKTPIVLAKAYNDVKTGCIPPTNDNNGNVCWRTDTDLYYKLVSKWMKYLDLGEIGLESNNGLIELNVNGHNIMDVGFGVSQALPIIVEGLYMLQDESLLLEQPEIHLHPEMQLKMADFLIALAKSEKNIIVETHSDHFINRIIHRVMQNYEELNDIVHIYIVDKNDTEQVRLKEINKYKGTKNDMNKYFFTQYDSEINDIVDVGLSNMMENL